MTGPEHFAQAQLLLESAQVASDRTDSGEVIEVYVSEPGEDGQDVHRNSLLAAQVHATLALAAATALSQPVLDAEGQRGAPGGLAVKDYEQWCEVAS